MFLLLMWQVAVWFFSIPSYVLPSPLKIFLSAPAHLPLVLSHAVISAAETLSGLFFALCFGVFSALMFVLYPKIYKGLHPLFLCFQSIPSFILMPLFVMWLGHGWWVKMLLVALSCYFSITSCFYNGLLNTPQILLDQAHLCHAKKSKTMTHIRFPCALPSLFSGLRLSAIYAPLCVLAVDWIGASSGLGYVIMMSSAQLEMELMFLSLFFIIMLNLSLYKIVTCLEKRIVFWSRF
jgi:putative hydroxymethylpyrimidine transport system permease protein